MTEVDPRLLEALAWATRIHDVDFEDWEGHAQWLESDPLNARAYEKAVLVIEDRVADVAKVAPAPIAFAASNDNSQDERAAKPWWRSTYAWSGALAASLAAMVIMPMATRDDSYVVQTGPGETRTLTLKDGTTIALNGDSAVRLKLRDSRHVTLEHGEAFLRVRHDAANPFELRASDSVFLDVGTAFNVTSDRGKVNLAVSEGAVAFDPNGENTVLTPGQAISLSAGRQERRTVAASSVGAWREGRLVYSDAPLTQVAADLSRTIGEPITLAPGITGKRFSGVLRTSRDSETTLRPLGGILDIDVSHTVRGWLLAPHSTAR